MSLGMLRLAIRPLVNSVVTTGQKLFSPKLLLYTNTAITISLSVTGDVLQQWYQARTKPEKARAWDRTRTQLMAGTGMAIGPLVHYWYIFLDRWLPGRSLPVLCKKVALDQLVCSPVYVSLFLLSLGLMENKTWAEIKNDFVGKGAVLSVAEWIVWPPAQFINFYFLPTKYRVMYDSTISLAFDCFWSYVCFEMDGEKAETETSVHGESKMGHAAGVKTGSVSESRGVKVEHEHVSLKQV